MRVVMQSSRPWLDVDVARAELVDEVERIATARRVAVAGTSDGTKIAVYREKYDVAKAGLAGDAEKLAILEAEATARGQTSADLAALVVQLGDSWRTAGLSIDAASGAHKVRIATLDLAGCETYDVTQGWPVISAER